MELSIFRGVVEEEPVGFVVLENTSLVLLAKESSIWVTGVRGEAKRIRFLRRPCCLRAMQMDVLGVRRRLLCQTTVLRDTIIYTSSDDAGLRIDIRGVKLKH